MVKINIYVVQFFLLALLNNCSNEQEKFKDLSTAESMYRLGENMKKSGDTSSAIKLYHQALAIDPDYKEANLSLVDILRVEGKFEECRSILDKILLQTPEDDKALNALGKVTIAQNDGPGCIKSYQNLHKIQPENPTFLNGLAICHDIISKHDQAQEFYQKAIALAPDNLNIQSNYGLSLALGGQSRKAIDLLSRLSQRSRTTLNIKHNLAVAYGLGGQTEKAKQLFQADLDPKALEQNMKVLNALNGTKHSKASENISRSDPVYLDKQDAADILLPTPQVVNKIIQEPLLTPQPSSVPAKHAKKKKKKSHASQSKSNQLKK